MQRSMFFDSVERDRVYTSDSWAVIFGKFVRDGYLAEEYAGAGLSVVPTDPAARKVKVNLGTAWVQGRAFEVYDTPDELDLAANTSGNPRIDRIVVRLDRAARTITVAVREGVPAASPSAPAVVRDSSVWELSLARVTVANGATTITAAQIVDERNDSTVCGVARGPRISTQAQPMTTAERDALTGAELFPGRLLANTNSRSIEFYAESAWWQVPKLYAFGDGSDGDVTISGTVTLSRDMHYRNLTVPVGTTLDTNGYRVFVQQTLTLDGTIRCDGKAGLTGGWAIATRQFGAGARYSSLGGSLRLAAQGDRDASGFDGYVSGLGGASWEVGGDGLLGGAGGKGGDSSGSAQPTGASGGSVPHAANYRTFAKLVSSLLLGVGTYGLAGRFWGGAGGGGGAKADNATGGGGGSGGGVVLVAAKFIVGSGTIRAKGGQGGDAGAYNLGGGGGGGGGAVLTLSLSALPVTITIDVSGGAGGTSGGGSAKYGVSGSSGWSIHVTL